MTPRTCSRSPSASPLGSVDASRRHRPAGTPHIAVLQLVAAGWNEGGIDFHVTAGIDDVFGLAKQGLRGAAPLGSEGIGQVAGSCRRRCPRRSKYARPPNSGRRRRSMPARPRPIGGRFGMMRAHGIRRSRSNIFAVEDRRPLRQGTVGRAVRAADPIEAPYADLMECLMYLGGAWLPNPARGGLQAYDAFPTNPNRPCLPSLRRGGNARGSGRERIARRPVSETRQAHGRFGIQIAPSGRQE